MSKPERFWLVYNPASNTPPRKRHWRKLDAEEEAARLVKEKGVKEVFVLSAVSLFRPYAPSVDHVSLWPSY